MRTLGLGCVAVILFVQAAQAEYNVSGPSTMWPRACARPGSATLPVADLRWRLSICLRLIFAACLRDAGAGRAEDYPEGDYKLPTIIGTVKARRVVFRRRQTRLTIVPAR